MSKSTVLSPLGDVGKTLPTLSTGVVSALQSLNVLGEIAQSYARTLAYRAEIKRLDVELVSINKQAELMHKKIDSEYKIRIAELEKEKSKLIAFFSSLNHQLRNQHIEKMTLFKMAKQLQQSALKSNNTNDRKMLLDMSQNTIASAMQLSHQSSISLDNLIKQLPNNNYKQLGRS